MTEGKNTQHNQMVKIPSGAFIMGSSQDETSKNPAHEVHLDAFWIDTTPVTNAQFKAFIKACPQWQKEAGIARYLNTYYLYTWRKGLIYPNGKRNHPAVYMNWFAAAAYCNWRSRTESLQECYDEDHDFSCNFEANGYRLPTEAEFEKAARGGLSGDVYPWGIEINKSLGNFDNNIGDTTEVASYPANNYGLFDMSGNIAHWCQDWFSETIDAASPAINPRGAKTGTYRTYRGGSWGNAEELQRCACRFWLLPTNCNPDFGFRCVRKA